LKQVVHMLGGKIVLSMNDTVTHVVSKLDSGKPRYTMKYCFGIVKGCWLVSFECKSNYKISYLFKGIKKSERFHCWQNENHFQLQERNTKLSLFQSYHVYLSGEFQTSNTLNKGELKVLLESGGATILSEAPTKKKKNQSQIIVACGESIPKIPKDIPCVTTAWVIESIVHYEARGTKEYAVRA
jgi:hypothetical protein